MAIYRKGREVTGIHRNGKDTQEVWKYIEGVWRLVWEAVRSLFITRDGLPIETRDGKMFDIKQ